MSVIHLVPNRWGALLLLLSGPFLGGEWAVAGPAASRASSVRDRLADAARGTRELSDRAAPGDPEAVKRRGIFLDPALKIFPSPEDLRRYPSVRPCAELFARNPGVRAAAGTPWTAADAPALREALSDEDPAVRALAIEALVTLSDPEDVPRIGGLLVDDAAAVPEVRDTSLGGVLCYSNELKQGLCGVPPETLAGHGAVSPETAVALADGIRRRTGAALGLSVTGIAGPGGGSPEKPVGLVYAGLADGRRIVQHRRVVPGDRDSMRERTASWALMQVLRVSGFDDKACTRLVRGGFSGPEADQTL